MSVTPVETTPCAYCRKPTLPEDATGQPWEWPGKGLVVACKRCAGTRANASAVDVGEGVVWEGGTYLIDEITRREGKVRIHMIDWDSGDNEITLTLDPTDSVEMFHRSGW